MEEVQQNFSLLAQVSLHTSEEILTQRTNHWIFKLYPVLLIDLEGTVYQNYLIVDIIHFINSIR